MATKRTRPAADRFIEVESDGTVFGTTIYLVVGEKRTEIPLVRDVEWGISVKSMEAFLRLTIWNPRLKLKHNASKAFVRAMRKNEKTLRVLDKSVAGRIFFRERGFTERKRMTKSSAARFDARKRIPEGTMRKGGLNEPPTGPRPPRPKGMG